MKGIVASTLCAFLGLVGPLVHADEQPRWVGWMESEDPAIRVKAVRMLRGMDTERAKINLRTALLDSHEDVRREAAVALGGDAAARKQVVTVLAEALGSEDWFARWQACLALSLIGPEAEAAIPSLLPKLCDEKQDVCREALLALTAIAPKDKRVLQGLQELLGGRHPYDGRALRYAARRGEFSYTDAWPLMAKAYWETDDADVKDRIRLDMARWDLPPAPERSVVEGFDLEPDDDDYWLYCDRVERLAPQNERGFAARMAASCHPTPAIRRVALRGFDRVSGKSPIAKAVLLKALDHPETQAAAMTGLGGSGDVTLVPRFVRYLPKHTPAATQALRALGAGAVADALHDYARADEQTAGLWLVLSLALMEWLQKHDEGPETLKAMNEVLTEPASVGLERAWWSEVPEKRRCAAYLCARIGVGLLAERWLVAGKKDSVKEVAAESEAGLTYLRKHADERMRLTDAQVEFLLTRWHSIQAEKPEEADLALLAALPEALTARFAGSKESKAPCGAVLAGSLGSKFPHVRKTAIECLKAIYGTDHGYRTAAPWEERAKAIEAWRKHVAETGG